MSWGKFTDKKRRPSEFEIEEAIAPQRAAWVELTHFVREKYAPLEEWKYLYGKNYGWALRFLNKKQLLINLYPSEGTFTVQVNLSEPAVQQALHGELGAHVRQVIEAAHPCPKAPSPKI